MISYILIEKVLSLIHAETTTSYSKTPVYFLSSTVKRLPSTLPPEPLPDLRADKGGDYLDLYFENSRLIDKPFAALSLDAFLVSVVGEYSM